MSKSTITRERLQEIAEDGFLKHGESKELARMALAATDGDVAVLPLYRHAQPSLVPDKMIYQDGVLFVLNNDMSSIERGTVAMRAWNACRAAMLQAGNSPVIPDGYVMVPMRLTAENGAKGALSGEFSETKFVNCPECFGDDECETCDGSGRIEIKVPVSWTTIKDIWIKGVEHFAAAPQENI